MSLDRFEARFAVLDRIPEALFPAVVTHTHGTLLTRARGLMQWREALLAGRLPDENELCWPDPSLRRVILKRLEALDIVRHCQQEEALTDDVLESILEGVASAEDDFRKAGDFDDRLAQRQKIRDRDSPFEDEASSADSVGGGGGPTSTQGDEDEGVPGEHVAPAGAGEEVGEAGAVATEGDDTITMGDGEGAAADDGQNGVAGHVAGGRIDPIGAVLEGRWGELATSWRELSAVLDQLGEFFGRGWDLTRGILATGGWRDIARYRRLLEGLPQLATLVAALGRLQGEHPGERDRALLEAVGEPMRRVPQDKPRAPSDHAIDTTEGVTLSDDVARMLPAESALLGHERLHTLWHARRAESMLYCYRLQGVLSEHTPQPEAGDDETVDTGDDPGHGPIVVCLDSSASMAGQPETIAKAVTLEALRIAGSERRDCLVIAFSGEGQTMQWRLDFTANGYRALLGFLRQSFHGGTDVAGALAAALDQLDATAMHRADLLLISDGRFPLPTELLPAIEEKQREQDTRIHGLLVGRWRSESMERLCDPLHRFDHWGVELPET